MMCYSHFCLLYKHNKVEMMTYNIDTETQKISNLKKYQDLLKYYNQVVASPFLNDAEKALLINIINDKHPLFIFKNYGRIWRELLHEELANFKKVKNNQNQLLVSTNKIKSLIAKYAELSDKNKVSIFEHANRYHNYLIEDILEISYHPELFDDYLKSIKGFNIEQRKMLYVKLFNVISLYKQSNNMNGAVSQAIILFNKLKLKSIPRKEMFRGGALFSRFSLGLLKTNQIDLDLCIKDILGYDSEEQRYKYGNETIIFVSEILTDLLEISNNALHMDNFWGVSPYGRRVNSFNYSNLFTDLVCLKTPIYLTVFEHFNKLGSDEKTTILCCEADVDEKTTILCCEADVLEDVTEEDDFIQHYRKVGKCTALKKIIENNSAAIPMLIKSIETLSIKNQAKIWQKEEFFISNYPDEVKVGFYLFKLKEKMTAFERKQDKPVYKKAYAEASSLYVALIKDRDDNQCRYWINLIETAKKDTSLTHHRGMKDIFIGLLLFPYSLYKLYKGTFFKAPFTRTDTAIILDELSNTASNRVYLPNF